MSDYSNSLKQEGRNLSKLVKKGQLPLPQFRDTEIDNALAAIRRGRSILVIGEPGVGKTSMLYQYVHKKFDEKVDPSLCEQEGTMFTDWTYGGW